MNYLEKLEPGIARGGLSIARTLKQAGYEALFAGGAVRNLLLERPVVDLDIATAAPPEIVESLFPHTVPVGRQFGVILVVDEGIPFEVATFREETGYQDGRHPGEVRYTDARHDAFRRDFTINALFLDPDSGQVLDFVNGRADLDARVIRAVGAPADRFEEDKLRLLRAVRFSAELGFSIDPATYEELCRRAWEIAVVSHERVRDEVLKILTGTDPAKGLELLETTGLLAAVLPEIQAMVGVEQPPEFHPEGDVFTHTCLMFTLAQKPLEVPLALGVLLHDVGKPPTFRVEERIRFDGHAELGAEIAERICRRLRVPGGVLERVVELVRCHLRFMHVREMRESTLKKFLRKDHFEDHLELHRLDCLSSHRLLENYDFCRAKLEEYSRETIRPEPLLRGRDLLAYGLKPGPQFSRILAELEELQLEGRLNTYEEAMQWLRSGWKPELPQ